MKTHSPGVENGIRLKSGWASHGEALNALLNNLDLIPCARRNIVFLFICFVF